MKRKRDAVTVALPLTSSAFATGSEVADKKALTLEGARKADAHKNNSGGVIAVVDDGGNLMALERLDGTFAAGANISVGKARTAALFKEATKFLEDVIGKSRTSMVALNDFTPLQGGVPSPAAPNTRTAHNCSVELLPIALEAEAAAKRCQNGV